MTHPSLTPTDIFFELFLPLFLEEHRSTLLGLSDPIQLTLANTPPQHWHIIGGKGPWLQRGPSPIKAALSIQFSPQIVENVVLGKQPDIQHALQTGSISFTGNPAVLKPFGLAGLSNLL